MPFWPINIPFAPPAPAGRGWRYVDGFGWMLDQSLLDSTPRMGGVARPFGARGGPPGTLGGNNYNPIMPVLGIPGGTLLNPVALPGTRVRGVYPHLSGTGAYISRETVLRLAANASRGSGHNTTRAPEWFVHAGNRTPGVRSNHSMVKALAGVDIRNPMIAPYALSYGMRAGATRIR